MQPPQPPAIPLWLRLASVAFLCVLVPVYWRHYGPSNFLWFSDIALFMATAAMWLGGARIGRSRPGPLLASMAALCALVADTAWSLDFLVHLLTGYEVTGMTSYMFDAKVPLHLRLISLFHLPLPPLLVWLVWRLGYDRRALVAQTLLAWGIYLVTYAIGPEKNINWTFGPGYTVQKVVHPLVYLGVVMIIYPLAAHVPAHLVLRNVFRPPPD